MNIDAKKLLNGLGGSKNVKTIEACITRLRVEVAAPDAVDEDLLRSAGAYGVVTQDGVIQVVVGPVADELQGAIEKLCS
ncbi:MAG: PTS transporter subunit EIIB [Ancrocorticia sp.]|jgi:PTS system N-acetylglucosamine-specific IIB component, Glc family (TC 4.A.1.1.5)|nr:PTS transporter subunit EIIB [Ancrocorticia sp.]MCI2178547.1 PTS transporter subunit EIIB [Ancrocorticia sp.]MCI2194301.1 PTS transporter subunit EIIB [Ancrocorticia sp.]MCI2199390.1 PTS transporter subunit EIIB [Ancrocorticia sp.]